MEATTTYPNWFAMTGMDPFQRHLLPLAGKPGLQFLQVGVYTGDATCWLVENVLTGVCASLTDVDTWKGSAEIAHEAFDWSDVERVYDRRTAAARKAGRVVKVKGTSGAYFSATSRLFDFVYVDAAHDTVSALADAEGAFDALRAGGLLAFDDYGWGTVAAAVNEFAATHTDQLEPLELDAQAWFRRIA